MTKSKGFIGERKNDFDIFFDLKGRYPELKPYQPLMLYDNVMVLRRCDKVEDTIITCIKTSNKCIRVIRTGYVTTNKKVTFCNYGSVGNQFDLIRRIQTYARSTSHYGGMAPRTFREIYEEKKASKQEDA